LLNPSTVTCICSFNIFNLLVLLARKACLNVLCSPANQPPQAFFFFLAEVTHPWQQGAEPWGQKPQATRLLHGRLRVCRACHIPPRILDGRIIWHVRNGIMHCALIPNGGSYEGMLLACVSQEYAGEKKSFGINGTFLTGYIRKEGSSSIGYDLPLLTRSRVLSREATLMGLRKPLQKSRLEILASRALCHFAAKAASSA